MLTVTTLVSRVTAFYPTDVRVELEKALPALSLQTTQLALEVLAAEQQGVRYCDAVRRADFLKMGRVYFGAANTLQWRVPPPLQESIKRLLDYAASGGFDPDRKLLFAVATRRKEPEAALYRFLLWVAVRVNLLALTWDDPIVEAFGALDEMEDVAEHVIDDLLDVRDMLEPDSRPFDVLMLEMALHMSASVRERFADAMGQLGSELDTLLTNAQALTQVRKLDAADAVLFWPGTADGPMGSQQIADRYPQHFHSANAMEQRRSRLLRQGEEEDEGDPPASPRFIDMLRAAGGEQ